MLKIKNKPGKYQFVELVEGLDCIIVEIDGVGVGVFYDDGNSALYKEGGSVKIEDRWKE